MKIGWSGIIFLVLLFAALIVVAVIASVKEILREEDEMRRHRLGATPRLPPK